MFTLLRGLLLFTPVSLAILAVPEGAEAHRYSSASLLEAHFIASFSTKDDALVDLSSGGLRVPNGALEPVKLSELDGWAGDDHASAFATFMQVATQSFVPVRSARRPPKFISVISPVRLHPQRPALPFSAPPPWRRDLGYQKLLPSLANPQPMPLCKWRRTAWLARSGNE
jgi:hypothetical protein